MVIVGCQHFILLKSIE